MSEQSFRKIQTPITETNGLLVPKVLHTLVTSKAEAEGTQDGG